MERIPKESKDVTLTWGDQVNAMYLVAKNAVKNVVNLVSNTIDDRDDAAPVPNKQGAENHFNE